MVSMPAHPLTAIPHLLLPEIQERYKSCTNGKERARWHAVFLIARGSSAEDAAMVMGYSVSWACGVVKVWNEHGPEGLIDRHAQNPGGRPALLTPMQQQELLRVVHKERPPDGGLWTGPKISRWIQRKTGQELPAKGTGWNYLVRLGLSIQRPRPKHINAAPETVRTVWKKNARSVRGDRHHVASGKASPPVGGG
jgi:transposase